MTRLSFLVIYFILVTTTSNGRRYPCIRTKHCGVELAKDRCNAPFFNISKPKLAHTNMFYYLFPENKTADGRTWMKISLGYTNIWMKDKPGSIVEEPMHKYCDIFSGVKVRSPTPKIYSRDQWGAQPPKRPFQNFSDALRQVVVIAETGWPPTGCFERHSCQQIIKGLQKYYLRNTTYADIPYNFLISHSGAAFEIRGWTHTGELLSQFDNKTISIAFIGNFSGGLRYQYPTPLGVKVAKSLIQRGVLDGYLEANYTLYGLRNILNSTKNNPGKVLYHVIHNWENFKGKKWTMTCHLRSSGIYQPLLIPVLSTISSLAMAVLLIYVIYKYVTFPLPHNPRCGIKGLLQLIRNAHRCTLYYTQPGRVWPSLNPRRRPEDQMPRCCANADSLLDPSAFKLMVGPTQIYFVSRRPEICRCVAEVSQIAYYMQLTEETMICSLLHSSTALRHCPLYTLVIIITELIPGQGPTYPQVVILHLPDTSLFDVACTNLDTNHFAVYCFTNEGRYIDYLKTRVTERQDIPFDGRVLLCKLAQLKRRFTRKGGLTHPQQNVISRMTGDENETTPLLPSSSISFRRF